VRQLDAAGWLPLKFDRSPDPQGERVMRKTLKKGDTPKTRAAARNGNVARARSRATKAEAVVDADRWLDTFVPYHLYRVTNKLNARLLKRLKALRINTSQWRVLSVLRAYGPLSIGAIVEATLLEQPTASRVIAQLERLGHVTRRLSDQDSRVAQISITAAGMEAFSSIVPAALKHQTIAFHNVSSKEIAMLVDILKRVEHNIEPEY
jgi:MarR family transcriptional regulator, organic hydroperoxide resistance regulator